MSIAVHTFGRLKADPGEPKVQEFVDGVDAVFALSDRSDGFIWRFGGQSGEAAQADRDAYSDDPRMVITLSVWETLDHLRHYVFNTLHGKFYERKAEWFVDPGKPMMALWHVDQEARPTLKEARDRLEHLQANGPSSFAFTWDTAEQFA